MLTKDNFFRILLAIFGVSLTVLIFSNIYSASIPKLVEEINNSAIGAIITAIITVVLLKHQSASEEIKDRNAKVFEEKSQKFSKFISDLWDKWSDFKIDPDEIEEIRKTFYRDVYIYLPEDKLEKMADHFKGIIPFVGKDLDNEAKSAARSEIFGIVNLLKEEIGLSGTGKLKKGSGHAIEGILNKIDGVFEALRDTSEKIDQDSQITTESISVGTFWHFISYNDHHQREILKSHSVLMLGDGEGDGDKRTKLLQAIQKGDIIFLYSRGVGYVGCFQAREQGKAVPMEERLFIKGEGHEGQIMVSELVLLDNNNAIPRDAPRLKTLQRIYDREAIANMMKNFSQKQSSPKLEEIYRIMSKPPTIG